MKTACTSNGNRRAALIDHEKTRPNIAGDVALTAATTVKDRPLYVPRISGVTEWFTNI